MANEEKKEKITQKIPVNVPGQMEKEGCLTAYLWDFQSENGGQQKETQKKTAVIICPGGGYWQVVEREGEPVAKAFARMACQTFVLEYSVLPDGFPTSLLELAKAVAIVRNRAKEWGVDPNKIVVCGFSAGGHLACSLGVFWNREFVWKAIGEKSGEGIRPNGMILGYPVITSGPYGHKKFAGRLFEHKGGPSNEDLELISLEKQVGSHTPKAFIWQTCADEDVPVENSLLLAMAMRREGINVELHIFPDGPHGLSLASRETAGGDPKFQNPHCETWLIEVEMWLKKL